MISCIRFVGSDCGVARLMRMSCCIWMAQRWSLVALQQPESQAQIMQAVLIVQLPKGLCLALCASRSTAVLSPCPHTVERSASAKLATEDT